MADLPKLSSNPALPKLSSGSGLPKLGGSAALLKFEQRKTETAIDKFSGFTRSFLESFPELFGIEPGFETEQYRARNPIGAFGSQTAAYLVPYAGVSRLAKGIPALEGAYGAIKTIQNPIVRGGATAALETGVFETARLGLAATPLPSAVFGQERDKPLTDLAGEAAFNVAAGGALGGAFGGIGAKFMRGRKVQDIVQEAAPDRPLIRQIQALDEALVDPNMAPEVKTRLTRERDQRIRYNLLDTNVSYADDGTAMVAPGYRSGEGKLFRKVIGQTKSNDVGGFLNRAEKWSTAPDPMIAKRRLVVDPKGGFGSKLELDSTLAAAGTTREELGTWAQNARVLEIKGGTKAGQLAPTSGVGPTKPAAKQNALTRATSIEKRFTNRKVWTEADGWQIAQEADDGLYVMAKKVKGQNGTPAAGDQWMFFRTANPEKFAKSASNTKQMLDNSGFFPTTAELGKIGEPIWDAADDILKLNAKGIPTKNIVKKGAVSGFAADSLETAGTYVAPTTMLGTRNPKLNAAFDFLKGLEGVVTKRVGNFVHGERVFDPKKSLGSQVLKPLPDRKKALGDFIRQMTPDEIKDVQTVLEEQIPFEQVLEAGKRGIFSQNTVLTLASLQRKSDELFQRLDALNYVVGQSGAQKLLKDFTERQGHYGITRDHAGKFTTYLNDVDGNIVGKVTGGTPQEALEKATAVIDNQAALGKEISLGGQISEVLRTPENLEMLKNSVRKPGFTKARGDLLGFDYSVKPLSQHDLIALIEKNLTRRENYIRDVVMTEKLAPIMRDLQRENPQDAQALQNVINRMQGNEGAFAKVQNAIVDKTLQSVGLSGSDSATGIVQATQKVMNSMQFAFGNITNPLLNVIGVAQTVIPELAYGLYASEQTLARNYASYPIFNKAGNSVGNINMLSPVKLFKNAMDHIATPWEKLPPALQKTIKQMADDGTLAARGVEEQFGVDGHILANPMQAFKDGGSFVRLLNSGNELLMTKTEEISRLMGIMSGYELAVARGLAEERIPFFVKSFVAKTSYNYATADKAHIFTGPVGSLAGTFKNWVFHYMGSMVKYATGGKEALPALAWQTGTTALIAGSVGTPLLTPLLDGASKFLSDKSFMENLYATTGGMGIDERVADGVLYGLPGIMGLSLASQASTPGSDPTRDANMMFSFAVAQRMKNLGDATKDALELYTATGQSPFESDVVRTELIRALAPRSIYRVMSTVANGAVTSPTTGYAVSQPMGLGGQLAYAAGFNTTELDKTYEVYNEIRNDQQRQKALVTNMGKALAQAWDEGDTVTADQINQRAMAIGLDYSGVLRSAQSVSKRKAETQLEFTAKGEDREDYGFMFEP